MKKLLFASLFAIPTAFAQTGGEVSTTSEGAVVEAPASSASAPYYAVVGEGKTLPGGVMRLRLPVRYKTTDKSYDSGGHKDTLPVDINVTGGAIVLEYGVNDRLSLQMKTDVLFSQKVKHKSDGNIRKSTAYKSRQSTIDTNTNAVLNGIAQSFSNTPGSGCTTTETCRAAIDSGIKAPQNIPVPNFGTIPQGAVINNTVRNGVENAVIAGIKTAAPEKDGSTGLGDTELGVLYAVLTKEESPVAFSVGGGLRIPTGDTEVDADELPRGRGTTDLGLRLNADYFIVDGLVLAWQNQTELMLAKGKVKAAGQSVDLEREGVRNVGFFKVAWGVGNVTQMLAPIGLYTSYNYDLDAKVKDSGAKAPRAFTQTFGMALDGLAYSIPAILEFEYEMPVTGRNTSAMHTFGTTLKAYYRF